MCFASPFPSTAGLFSFTHIFNVLCHDHKIGHTVHVTFFTDCAMDHVLNIADSYFFTPYVYPASWPEDVALRQIISLWVVTNLGAELIYLGFGALNFYFVFNSELMKHPQFIKVNCLMHQALY